MKGLADQGICWFYGSFKTANGNKSAEIYVKFDQVLGDFNGSM